jgi:L-seryl-tRNA(Ser) seleniumtransferase
MSADPRSKLPSVDQLTTPELVAQFGHARVVRCARRIIEGARAAAVEGQTPVLEDLQLSLENELDDRLTPVINATGILLHTNLGRAPWGDSAIEAAQRAMGYTPVELELESGRRGHRGAGVEDRICALTGAESALVVNNCAAAVLLMLTALAKGRGVLVSRGELVEIGGGFRIPDVMAQSGARLVEVGATNRTHLKDFTEKLDSDIAGVLRVHHSNFRQIGFVSSPSLEELASLNVPLLVDLGSGQLDPADGEPCARAAVAADAAAVCISGDKLLGGPQAGIVFGQTEYIEIMRRHALYRALRPDKVILAALEGTLDDWLRGISVPLRAMREAPMEVLESTVRSWQAAIESMASCRVVEVEGAVGGGSLPGRNWPSWALAIDHPRPDALHHALRSGTPTVLARIEKDAVLLDARTVTPLGRDEELVAALIQALKQV